MRIRFIFLTVIALTMTSMFSFGQAIDNTMTGKIFCGYQGWFNCKGDGSPLDGWVHWGRNAADPENLTFEVWPDVTDYQPSSLFQSGFAALGNGQPAKLFSSYKEDVIDTHCSWMKKYGIDGLALQRFLGPVLSSAAIKENRDSVAARLQRAAEKHGTLYYLMYDMAPDDVAGFKGDFLHMENDIKFMDSPNYATQDGKPVICLWGIGFEGRDCNLCADNSLELISWLKGKGYYIIGGVNNYWDDISGQYDAAYKKVYKELDMISPWTPGRYRHVGEADAWKINQLIPEKNKCDELGVDYQPVVFSGFAWSNWNGGDQNSYPRHKGEFLWTQIENIVNLDIPFIYVAMFDEYDEGTNIMKMADSYLQVPSDQYFLTSSADGTYISSDFYLRLVGKGSRVLKGLDPVTTNVTIPYSEGPVYFRTSIEPGYDAMPNWTNTEDDLGVSNVSNLKCSYIRENAYTGNYSIKFEGTDDSETESYAAMKVFNVDIPVFDDMKLMFRSFPTNELSRYVSVELVLKDGTTLSSNNATDREGNPMLPSAGRGEVNKWTKTICRLGEWLDTSTESRDTIDKIIIKYDHAAETGDILTYFDDISIYRLETDEVEINNAMVEIHNVKTQMDPGETITVSVTAINTGTAIWSAEKGYKLASQNPQNNEIWGVSKIDFGEGEVRSDATKIFTFEITAPNEIGKYSFQWQIIKEVEGKDDILVGESSQNIVITVGEVDGTNYAELLNGIVTRRAEIHSGEGAEKAFDGIYSPDNYTKWLDNSGIPDPNNPRWIQIEFPEAVTVDMLAIVSGNDYPHRDPEDFTLKASNDGETWVDLKSWTGVMWNTRFEEKLLPLDNSTAYKFFRLEITKNKGNDQMTQVCEIKLIQVGVFIVMPEKATNPNPFHYSTISSTSTELSWSAGDNTLSYDVYFGTSIPPDFIGNQSETTFNPGTLEPNTLYYWRVDARNNDGVKTGDLWIFTTNNLTGIEDRNSENRISITNPDNRGIVRIQQNNINEQVNIMVFSINGKLLKQTKSSNDITVLNISEFNKGVYVIKVYSRLITEVELIVIQ